MKTVREALLVSLLLVGCVVGLQVSYLLAQAGQIGNRLEEELLATSHQAQATLLYAQAVLSSTRGTTEILRRSAEQQMGYYEAIGRRSSLVLGELALLLRHTDDRMERITTATEDSLKASGQAMASVAEDSRRVSQPLAEFIETTTATANSLNELASSPEITGTLSSMNTATSHLAGATKNVEEATGYVRDMLSPTKKSFWRRLLELMIPRPTLGVR